MRVVFELLRIFLLFVLLGGLGAMLLSNIYINNEIASNYAWLGAIAMLLLIFVLYRNKLQFSGWYKSEQNKKLPKSISNVIICVSVVLIISPFIISMLLS